MFEDSLIESGGRLRTKRGATTVFSFVLQVALIGVLVLLPLLFTEALPKTQLMTFLVAPPPPPPPPPPAAAPVKVIKKIQPAYTPLARQARIQGSVLLQAQISKEGTIEHLTLISGHPMLAPAAIEAVKQWRYKPYILNGEPVEVDTQITVNFTLSGG